MEAGIAQLSGQVVSKELQETAQAGAELLQHGHYAQQLRHCFSVFPKNRVQVMQVTSQPSVSETVAFLSLILLSLLTSSN